MEGWETDLRILDALRGRQAFVQWEDLARVVGCAPGSLRRRVEHLVAAGHQIEERAGVGLRLVEEGEPITAEDACRVIPAGFLSDVRTYGVVGSTNDLARRLARDLTGVNALVLAEGQTRGRGRQRRAWFSPLGVGLWFSLILWPSRAGARSPALGLLASVAVASAIRRLYGIQAEVKWPNDVLVGGRKVCGILSELADSPGGTCAVVGIGINVNQAEEAFPAELRTGACSLRMHVGREVDRLQLLGAVLGDLALRYGRYEVDGFAPFRPEWESLSGMVGRRVRVSEGAESHVGRATGLRDDGALRIETDGGGSVSVVAGDVEILEEG